MWFHIFFSQSAIRCCFLCDAVFLRSIWNLVKYVAAQRITFTALLKGTCRGLRKKRYNNTLINALCFKYSLFWRLWLKFQWNFPKIQRRDYIATTAEEGWEIYHDPPDKVICTSLLWAENNNINFEVWSWSPLLLRFCFITLQRMQSPMMMMMMMSYNACSGPIPFPCWNSHLRPSMISEPWASASGYFFRNYRVDFPADFPCSIMAIMECKNIINTCFDWYFVQ